MESWNDDADGCDLDLDLDLDAEPIEVENQGDAHMNEDSVESQAIITKFADMVLKQTEAANNCVRKTITTNRNTCSQLLEQKMMLLCGLSSPIADRLATVIEIGNMQKQVLKQFYQVYTAEEKYVSAYAAHCDKAIQATCEQERNTEFDEYTNMSYATLCDYKTDMESQYERLRQAGMDEAAKQKSNQMKYESEYNLLLKEIELFEEYNVEALGTLDALKFELKKSHMQNT